MTGHLLESTSPLGTGGRIVHTSNTAAEPDERETDTTRLDKRGVHVTAEIQRSSPVTALVASSSARIGFPFRSVRTNRGRRKAVCPSDSLQPTAARVLALPSAGTHSSNRLPISEGAQRWYKSISHCQHLSRSRSLDKGVQATSNKRDSVLV